MLAWGTKALWWPSTKNNFLTWLPRHWDDWGKARDPELPRLIENLDRQCRSNPDIYVSRLSLKVIYQGPHLSFELGTDTSRKHDLGGKLPSLAMSFAHTAGLRVGDLVHPIVNYRLASSLYQIPMLCNVSTLTLSVIVVLVCFCCGWLFNVTLYHDVVLAASRALFQLRLLSHSSCRGIDCGPYCSGSFKTCLLPSEE